MNDEDVPTLAWYYRHYSLCFDYCDTTEEAISYLRYGEDNGNLSAVGIETADGGLDTDWKKHPIYLRREADEKARWKAEASEPPPEAHLMVLAPPGQKKEEIFFSAGSVAEMEARAAELALVVGADRVRVVKS